MEQAKQKGFKDASVISYSNKTLVKGQAKTYTLHYLIPPQLQMQALESIF